MASVDFQPADETARLRELLSLELLDTPREERFDRLTTLATHVFGVPIALISLIDDDRQWIKSGTGVEIVEIPRHHSFCGHTIAGAGLLVVNDAAEDPEFADHPLVTGEAHVRFYAGYPLLGPTGQHVGAFSLMDTSPRELTPSEAVILEELAEIAQHELRSQAITETTARLRRTEARYAASFTQAPIGMAMVQLSGDRFGSILEVNQAMVELTGYPADESVGRSIQDFVHSDDLSLILEGASAAARGEVDQLDREIRLRRADGEQVWVRVRSRRVNDDDGGTYGIVHITDITARRKFEDELARLALHDPLTGLANRRLLTERLTFALAALNRNSGPVAVIYVDFDHFKEVNDTYGHEAGDALIVEAARRLAETVRTVDTAGRFGGDEFVIVCPDLTDRDAAKGVADRIQVAFTKPIDVGPAEVCLSLSGGIAITEDADSDPARLLSAADEALYKAKQAGRNRFELAPPVS